MPERVRKLQAIHIKLMKFNDHRWCRQEVTRTLTPAMRYFCVAFDAEEAKDWSELDLIHFEDRCRWERRFRMDSAAGLTTSSYIQQFPQLLANQYITKGEPERKERPRTIDAYRAAYNARHGALRATNKDPVAGDPTVEVKPSPIKQSKLPNTPKAGPKAIQIVAPTPEWEATQKAKKQVKHTTPAKKVRT